ncbi:MAG: ATP-binding protein, partial [Steroidobacter sp.]
MNDTQREFAEIITSSANSLLAIINDVLDLSKVEASKLSIEHIEFDLRDLIDEGVNMMSKQIDEKGVEFIVDIDPDLPERAKGDPHRVRQCILNLLSNAYKVTQQGQILLTVSRNTIAPDMIEFAVSDSGIGITEETIGRLFRPFVQADSSTTRRFGGTGLGLSIVKRLIELMQGEIGVSSVPGRGSRFWFKLPLLTANSVAQKAHRARNQSVMLIEYNDARRNALVKQLAFMGFKVVATASVAEALPLLRQAMLDKQNFASLLVNEALENLQQQLMNHQSCKALQLQNTGCLVLCKITRKQKADTLAGILGTRVLCEPVNYRELQRVMTSASPKETLASTAAAVPRASTSEDKPVPRLPGEVLLVEDNIVNQKVAIRFLQRLGAKVTVANNGAEGVDLIKRGQFALVLMDVQMPVMDGFEATRCIRALDSSRRDVPIVALTANAMPEDRNNCLSAGMNEFLTKPLQIDKLAPLVNDYCARAPQYNDVNTLTEMQVNTILSETHSKPVSAGPQVDFTKLNMVVGDDRSFLTELVDAYVQTAREVIRELKTALSIKDTDMIARSAHKLKGASSN